MSKRFSDSRVSPAAFTALTVLAALGAGSQQANAQQMERVTITGTNIPRAQTETAAPVLTIPGDAIEASGKSTVAEYLQTLSVDGQGSLPTSFGNGFAPGATAISLRGMGATSTLVLINGRRMAPYGRADDGQKIFTDLSSIPMELVDRIEILLDGASAIYGADAIAGVVNVILRETFDGTVAKASYGTNQHGQGGNPKVSLTHGRGSLASDRYNFMLNAEISRSESIFYRDIDRDWIGKADGRPWGYPMGGSGTIVSGTASPNPAGAVRNPTTLVYQQLPGCSTFSRASPQDPGGGCLWYGDQFRMMEPEIESANLYGRGTWQLSGESKAYAEIGYSRKKTQYQGASGGPGVTPTVTFPGTAAVPGGIINYGSGAGTTILMAATHPQNPFGAAARVRYAAWDVGPEIRLTDNSALRAVAGLTGTARGWDYNMAYSHSEASLDLVHKNRLYMNVVKDALGNPASPYFPYYIGTEAGRNPASLYSAMRADLQTTNKSSMDILDLKGSRDVAKLHGGPMSVAAGAEYRRQSYSSPSPSGTENGSVSQSYVGSSGSQTVFAAYAEVLAPVAKTVELSAALRHDSYDNFNSTTPKLGIKFTPVRELLLRATYSEGFRAPGATESNPASQSAIGASARDPVRCPGGTPAPGSTPASCNQGFTQIITGTPEIRPEKSKGYTIGAVWDPLQNTSFTVDWWKIQRTDEINPMTFAEAAALPPCTQIRGENDLPGVPCSGTLQRVFAPFQNSAKSEVRGSDFAFRQRFNFAEYGRAVFEMHWSHLSSWERIEKNGTRYQFADTHGNCDVSNCRGTPEDKVNLVLNWDKGSWRVTGLLNWRSTFANKYFEGPDCAVRDASGTDAPNGCRIGSFWTADVSVRWQAEKNLQIFGSIQNLFDRVAPLDPLTYGAQSYNPMDQSGAMGRYYKIGVRYQLN